MPWARFDDDLLTNDKYLGASVEAKLLWHTSIIYCAKNLTDGFVRAQIVPAIGRLAGVGDVGPIKAELLDARLWEEAEGGIIVHDYLEYNPSKEEALALKAARADAGARGGVAKASNRLASAKQVLEQKPSNEVAKTYPVPGPGPGPVPGPETQTPENHAAPTPRTRKPKVAVQKIDEPEGDQRKPVMAAFIRGMNWAEKRLTDNDWGQIRYAIKHLPGDLTAEEIDLAFKVYPSVVKGCMVTPPAIAKHFSTLMAAARRNGQARASPTVDTWDADLGDDPDRWRVKSGGPLNPAAPEAVLAKYGPKWGIANDADWN